MTVSPWQVAAEILGGVLLLAALVVTVAILIKKPETPLLKEEPSPAHRVKCDELRAEFFGECQKTATRQQCEALYGQTGGRLFDGPPHLPFVSEMRCP